MTTYQRITTPWVHWWWGRGLLANWCDRQVLAYVRAVKS
jgi:hypothetical protein